ncbi:MAG TPA: beta-propeller domain-containing protein, partial [Pyrinomonadaceae bacterium]
MKLLLSLSITVVISVFGLLACTEVPANGIPPLVPIVTNPVKKTMRSFGSEQELSRFLRELAEKNRRGRRELMKNEAAATPAAEPLAEASKAKSDDESVTNVQHAGVDEGGIVKVHGDHLVVLRRGRLFTVAIGDGALKPISTVDAFGPDMDPSGTWYDEMLVSGDTIVVIGYSYQRGGTEVGLFNIDPAGQRSYRSTYHLRSN